ncbi:MAG: class I SAM-dependent methyltransferase, partial [bacterium]|jgi:SAM-dependent methyltransferase|nr:class I SAM-dependent methyltransferase [bacterium]
MQLDAGEPLPFAGGTFSAAICTDVLPHLRDPLSTLRELRRVLEPGGHLIVDTTNRSPWWMLRFPRGLGRRPGQWLSTWRAGGISPEWQAIVHHQSYAEFRGLLGRARFAVAEERRYGPFWCAKWFLARCRPAT